MEQPFALVKCEPLWFPEAEEEEEEDEGGGDEGTPEHLNTILLTKGENSMSTVHISEGLRNGGDELPQQDLYDEVKSELQECVPEVKVELSFDEDTSPEQVLVKQDMTMEDCSIDPSSESDNEYQSPDVTSPEHFDLVCDSCDRPFVVRSYLSPYKKMLAGENPHLCNGCRKSNADPGSLMKTHPYDDERQRPYICGECGKGFCRRYHLRVHSRIHTGVKPYSCNRCNKTFTQRSQLTVHINTHTGYRPHMCSQCGKGFYQPAQLTAHLNVHSGSRPHICNVCGKGYIDRKSLTRHLYIHAEHEMYKCNTCDKSFTRRGYLAAHLVIHTNERPYACKVCEKDFSRRSQLTEHLKIHSGVKAHNCTHCTKSFTRRSNLKSHLKTHKGRKS